MYCILNLPKIVYKIILSNYSIIFYLLIEIRILKCDTCKTYNSFSNNECFNNIIIFNDKEYRAGHFAKNKNGDMIIEYSKDDSRLFYGLKKNGNYYFGDSPIKIIENINNDESLSSRYESNNIFVSIQSDINKEKEYLFSISSSQSITELHDLENNNYVVRKTENFIENEIYSYQIPLLEISNQNIYFCIYTHLNNTEAIFITIKKFGFTNFNLNSYNNINSVTISNNANNRIISSIIIDDYSLIVLFFLRNKNKLSVNFYDFDLNDKGNNQEVANLEDPNTGDGIFFKAVYLDNLIVALIYFNDWLDVTSLIIKTIYIIKMEDGNYSRNTTKGIDKNINQYDLRPDITLNDFLKINNDRLAFISTYDYMTLYIILFDFYNNYENIKMRFFYHNLPDYIFALELSAFVYNDYLAFTSTVKLYTKYFSIFMIFGYANGTENTIDISPYFTDSNYYDINNNLINKLNEDLIIDNNIFGYIPANKIKLITIPIQISFYNGENNTKLIEGNILEYNHKFEQRNDLIKNNDYYSFDYQFIIKEPDYNTFYSNPFYVINYPSNSYDDQSNNFKQNEFYGKTNKVKFKLCHKYCATCKTIGNSDDNQQCLSCLEEYQYYFNEFDSNCVPYGHFFDKEERKIVECNNTNSKFYINITNNKKICFKKTYNCPSDYSHFNITSNECQYYTPPTTILTTIPTTILTTLPTTILTTIQITIPTIIPTINFTNIPISIIDNQCAYNKLLNNNCTFENDDNTIIYNKIKNGIVQTYPENGQSVLIEGKDNYIFQITTDDNEENTLNGYLENKNNMSIIDLGECENLLKKENHINEDDNLIIVKLEKKTNIAYDKNVQYEIYDPITLKQLDLSICENTPINLYIPLTLSEKTQNLYDDLQEYGYDLFNINDSFYQDICTPYTSKNKTDVLLSDRKNDFYDNETTCQANCKYSSYISESKYLKCECNIDSEDIDTNEPEKFNIDFLMQNFYNVLKYSNFRVLKCYKLVFNLDNLKKNIGSIISMLFFLFFIIFTIIYCFKGFSSLKVNILDLLKTKEKNNQTQNILNIKINKVYMNINDKTDKNISKKNINNNILKRSKSTKITKPQKLKTFQLKKKSKQFIFESSKIDNSKKTNKHKKISCPSKKNRKSNKTFSFKNIINNNNIYNNGNKNSYDKSDKDSKNLINSKGLKSSHNLKLNETRKSFKSFKTKKDSIIFQKGKHILNKQNKILSDFELNDLDYYEAIKLDKRKLNQIYWSILKREHIILFTFLSCNDYNIIYVKFAKFFFLICQDMGLNVVFFNDKSMHKIYLDYGKYNFIQHITQFCYSTLVSSFIDVFLCYLCLTDKHFYQIKNLKNKNDAHKIIKCIKIKLFSFFILTFILFAFYWYFISVFCAVYQNTQIIFIKDSFSSFLASLLYPFILYFLSSFLRIIAIRDVKKKRFKCLYKLSDLIPFF